MKATELRLGNLFNYWKDRDTIMHGRITTISKNNIVIDSRYSVKLKKLNPISLTEEWLIKFGLNNPVGIHNSVFSGLISIDVSFNVGAFYIGDIEISRIKYVHELQNLYFALTQKELTLKP